MESYEAMFLLKPDLTKEGLDKAIAQVQDVIGKSKGTVGQIKEWARQKMAYPIKKHKEAVYYLADLHIDPLEISKIKKAFGLNESILRVLITKK